MEQFFYSTQIYDETIILPEDEAAHVLKVLRKKTGAQIKVVDGRGNLYHTYIDSENIHDCRLNIISIDEDYKHQNYYEKKFLNYLRYKKACGREEILNKIWN